MSRRVAVLVAVVALVLACATSGPALTSSWRAPETQRLQFHRAMTSFVTTDSGLRRSVEDRMATRIPGSFPAYSAVPNLSLTNAARAREQLRGKLFDGAVVVRVIDVGDAKVLPPGQGWYSAYPDFASYWSDAWRGEKARTSPAATTGVAVEVVIYTLGNDQLVWAGRTEPTTGSRSVEELVDRSVDVVMKELRSARLIR